MKINIGQNFVKIFIEDKKNTYKYILLFKINWPKMISQEELIKCKDIPPLPNNRYTQGHGSNLWIHIPHSDSFHLTLKNSMFLGPQSHF